MTTTSTRTRRSYLTLLGTLAAATTGAGLLGACSSAATGTTGTTGSAGSTGSNNTSGAAASANAAKPAPTTAPAAAQPTTAPAKPVSGKVTWMVRNNANEVDWEKNGVTPDLTAKFPNLTLDIVTTPGGTEYNAKLTSLVVAGTPPEVFTHWGGDSFVDYLHNGWLADLTPLMSRDKVDVGAFLPSTVEWFKNKGKQYALPFSQSYGSFLFYNKTILDKSGITPPPTDLEPGWTWDAMIQLAQKATVAPGTAEAIYGMMPFGTGQFLSPTLAKLWGGDIFTPEHYQTGIAQKTLLDTQPVIDSHQARQDLLYRTRVAPTPDDIKTMGVTGDLFQAGKIAFYPGQGWLVRNYVTNVKDFQWGIAPIPPKKASSGPQFTDAWMLGKQAANPDGGWAFIKYLLTTDAQKTMATMTGTAPAVKAAEDAWFALMGDRMPLADVKKVTNAAVTHSYELNQHTFARWSDINSVITSITNPIWANNANAADAMRAGKPQLDEVVAKAYQEYQNIL